MRSVTAGVALLVAPTLPVPAQVLIDDFSDAQTLFAPPGASSSVAGSMLGGTRDAVLELTGGPGPVLLDTASGDLFFDVANGSSGVAVLTWDADTDPLALDATGLTSTDLTAGGASAFRLVVGSFNDLADAIVEVYTDAGNASRGAFRTPLAPAQDVLLSFGEMAPFLGAGANFADVGAIVLTVRATATLPPSTGVVVERFETVIPALAATKVDALTTDGDMDGLADPGDTLTYTITITNPGGEALAVDLADAVDPNTTLVPGSVSATPIAKGDQYATVGNVLLEVDGTPLPPLLANDDDPDGDTLTITAIDPFSFRGGPVILSDAATGSFTYTPPAGFRGVDTFTYTAEDDDGNTAVGTATILVEGIVWFVDNTNTGCGVPPCGVGTQADPFESLKQAETASEANDVIRVRQGTGTDAGHDEGFIAKIGQRLVGGAADLVIAGNLIEAGAGRSVHSHGAGNVFDLAGDNVVEGVRLNPTIGHGLAGTGTSNVVADDVVIYSASGAGGVSLTNHTGGFTFSSSMITSTAGTTGVAVDVNGGSGLFQFAGSPISHDGGGLIHVQDTTGGATFDFTGSNPSLVNGTDDGILLSNNTGGASFTFDAIGDVGTGAGNGIRIAGSGTVQLDTVGNVAATGGAALDVSGTTIVKGGAPGAVAFASLAAAGGTVGVNLNGVVPAVTVNGATTVNSGDGVALQTSGPATFTGQLAVTSTAGAGISAANTGQVSVVDNTSTVSSTGGPALDVTNTSLAMTFASLAAAPGGGGRGVSLVGATGTVTTTGGAVTGGTAGTAFHVSGGSPTFTHGGTVTQNNAQRVVNIEDTTGGSVGFGGKVTGGQNSTGVRIHNADGNASFADLDLGTSGARMAATGITLSGGSAGTFTFADTQVFTNGATGFDANNGGTVEVTGAGNRVDSTNATAVDFRGGTTIGVNGVTFERVDASNASAGILLSSTGSAGGFTVTGSGAAGSGGTIQNVTEDGIRLVNAHDVSLAFMNLSNVATVDRPGGAGSGCFDNSGADCNAGIEMISGSSGLTIDNVVINGSGQQGISGDGVVDFTMTNSQILNAGNGSVIDEGGILFSNLGGTVLIEDSLVDFFFEQGFRLYNTTASPNVTIRRATFSNNSAASDGLQFLIEGGTTTVLVDDSDFNDIMRQPIDMNVEDVPGGVLNLTVQNSRFLRGGGLPSAISVASNDDAQVRLTVSGCTMTDGTSTPINLASVKNSTFDAILADNVTTNPSVTNIGRGIRLANEDGSDMTVLLDNNTLGTSDFGAIEILSREVVAGFANPTLHVTMVDNTMTAGPPNVDRGIHLQSQTAGSTVCLDLGPTPGSGNNTGIGNLVAGIRVNRAAGTFQIESAGVCSVSGAACATGLAPPGGCGVCNPSGVKADVEAFIDLFNSSSPVGADADGGHTSVAAGTCRTPAATPTPP